MSSTAAAAHPRGRDAEKPTEIPAPGWKEIALRVFKQFSKDRVLLVAAGTTFYLLLAMVPAMTAFVSLYGLFADPSTVQQHITFIQEFLPSGGQEIIGEQLTRLSQQPNSGLGFALAISLALALWSTNAGMKALFESMNVAYDEEESRGFIKLTLISLAFTLGAIVLLLTIIGVVVIMPLVVESLGLGALTELVVKVGSGLLLLVAGLVGLSALYRWGPSRKEAEWKWITPGATVAIVIAMIGSLLFSWYVANFGSYNETYGSLGAIIGFMTWLWIMVIFIITGGELNAEMEHQTLKDTTTGPEKPLGARGAEMADTVADADAGKEPGKASGEHSGKPAVRSYPRSEGQDAVRKPPAAGHTGAPLGSDPQAAYSRSEDTAGSGSNTRSLSSSGGRLSPSAGNKPGAAGKEPLGLTGGLMLLGALALAVAAGNAGRKGASPRPGQDPNPMRRRPGREAY